MQYLAKFDTQGNCKWAKHTGEGVYGSIIFDKKLITDKKGDLLLTGTFKQFMQFADDTIPMETWYYHSYITKLDTGGNMLWSKKFSNNEWEVQILDMITDDSNNIFVSGIFKDSINLGSGFIAKSDSGNYDGFVAKLDTAMNPIWMKIIGGKGNQYCRAMALMKDTLYLTGYFDDKLTFNGITNTTAGLTDIFLISLSADSGKFKERNIMGDASSETTSGIFCLPSNHILISGNYVNYTTLGSHHASAIDQIGQEVFIIDFDKYHTYYSINDNYSDKEDISVYPNPSSDRITVETKNVDFYKNSSVTILNIQGQQLIQQSLNNNKAVLDVSSLSNGIYFLKINSESGNVVRKFVKEK